MMVVAAVTHIVKLWMTSVQVCVEILCYVLIRLLRKAGSVGQGTRLDVEANVFTANAVSMNMKTLEMRESGSL